MDEDEVIDIIEDPQKPDLVYYSHSKLRNQSKCPAINYYSYLEKTGQLPIPQDPSYPLVFGSAAHKGIELCLKEGRDPYEVSNLYVQEHLLDKFDAKLLDYKKIQERLDHTKWCLSQFLKELYPSLSRTLTDPEHQTEVTIQAPFRKGVLTGVVDLMMDNGVFVDWKSSMKIPKPQTIINDPQSAIYYWIAKACGLTVPTTFEYVYLTGENVHMKEEVLKSGKNKGKTRMVKDDSDPWWKLSYPVFQDEARVERIMRNYVIPLAKQYEQKVYYKVKNEYNCNNCQYRTACDNIDLPEVVEDGSI